MAGEVEMYHQAFVIEENEILQVSRDSRLFCPLGQLCCQSAEADEATSPKGVL